LTKSFHRQNPPTHRLVFAANQFCIGVFCLPQYLYIIKQTITLSFTKMNTYQNPYMMFDGMTPEEFSFLQQATASLTETQQRYFLNIYGGKRKNPQDIMLATLLGFLGVSGIQRFMTDQIGMGLVYFFTAGFCFIGTIIDLINYKDITTEYNKKMAFESFNIAKMSN
jgi:TM2 domain-containing membrane protein YozV